jgi:hypothetical protein
MITVEKAQMEMLAYGLTVLLVTLLMVRYGRQALKWVLMGLYEIFIQKNPIKL